MAEGRLLARLKSPRLVRVHNLLESPTGEPCYVMDLVLGPDGRPATLEDMRQAGTVEERDVFRWYADMAEALRIVHAAGVVHRDVKLTNILVAADLSRAPRRSARRPQPAPAVLAVQDAPPAFRGRRACGADPFSRRGVLALPPGDARTPHV